MRSIILIFLNIFFITKLAYTQPRRFEVVLNESGIDNPRSIQQTSDSGYIVCGTSNSYTIRGDMDPYLVKFSSTGVVEWKKFYSDASIDNMKSVLLLNDGGFLMSGFTNKINSTYSPYLIRTNSNGEVIWEKIYEGNDWEFLNASVELSDGNFILTGSTYRVSNGSPDGFIMKVDPFGNSIWKNIIPGTLKDEINSLQKCSNGDLILCGTTYSFGSGGSDIWLLRYENNGNLIWSKTFGGPLNDFGYSVEETANGNIIFCGSSQSLDSVSQFIVARADSNGNELWRYVNSKTSDETFYSVHETTDGNLTAAGFTGNQTGGNEDFYLLRMNANGDFMWAKTYGGLETEICYNMILTSDSGYAMIGETNTYGSNFPNLYLIKTDTFGVATGVILNNIEDYYESSNPFSVFPNPANEIVKLKLNTSLQTEENKTIEIISIEGVLVKTFTLFDSKNVFHFSTSDISSGFYFVILKTSQTISIKRLCIQH